MRDSAVTMLMTKHIGEFTSFPVFYYGQAHMSSLESGVSAFFCRLAGFSPLAACAGTILFGGCAVWLVHRMTLDIAPRRAAFFACAYLLTGSDTLLYLSAHPRGGYMTVLLFGLLTLQYAHRYTYGSVDREPGKRSDLLRAGFFAGLGWWGNQLMIVYLLAGLVLFLPRLRFFLRKTDWIWALACFFLGSAPWWWWNFNNDWQTFAFSNSFDPQTIAAGLSRFWQMAPAALGWKGLQDPFPSAKGLAAILLLLIALGGILVSARTKGNPRGRTSGLALHWAVLVIMAITYSLSHFSALNTARYLIPLVPSVSLLAGVAIDRMLRFRPLVLPALLLFATTLPFTTYSLPDWMRPMERDNGKWQRGKELGDFLAGNCDGVAIGPFLDCWVSVASNEKGVVVDFPVDAYAPYNRRAMEARNQAFLANHGDIRSFLKASNAPHVVDRVAGFSVAHRIQAPSASWSYVPQQDLLRVWELQTGRDLGDKLQDADLDTLVELPRGDRGKRGIGISFHTPQPLVGILFPNSGDNGFRNLRLEAVDGDGNTIVLLESVPRTSYFWSGPRISVHGMGYNQIYRFPCPGAGIREIAIIDQSSQMDTVRVPEILLLREDPRTEDIPPEDQIREARDHLRGFEQGRLYAPRWVLESLHTSIPSTVTAQLPSYVHRHYQELAKNDPILADYLEMDRSALLLMAPSDAPRSKALLLQHGLAIREESRGRAWTRLIVAPKKLPAAENLVPLYWTEQGLWNSSLFRHRRRERAADLEARADRSADAGEALDLLTCMVRLAPEYRRGVLKTLRRLEAAGRHGEAAGILAETSPFFTPGTPAPARFPQGLDFLGATVTPQADVLDVTYFWELSAVSNLKKWSVFVHFMQDNRILFQDDHSLADVLSPEDQDQPGFPQVVRVHRRVPIPPGARGNVTLVLGCVDPVHKTKARVRSPFRIDKDKVALPRSFPLSSSPDADASAPPPPGNVLPSAPATSPPAPPG